LAVAPAPSSKGKYRTGEVSAYRISKRNVW
jgi:hypothetical protein